MNCPRCGGHNPDDGNFCTGCGFDLRPGRQSPQPPPQEDTLRYRPAEEIPYYEDPRKKKKRETAQKKAAAEGGKKRRIWPCFLIPVATLGVAFGILAGVATLRGSAGGEAVVYLSDTGYQLVNNLKGWNPTELGSGVYGGGYDGLVTFSGDGKYVYYFTQLDYSSETGTLCRAEYGRLKGSSSKNSQYMEILATNVQVSQCRILEDGRVFYLNAEGTLCRYDGDGVTQIARNVTQFYVDETREEGRLAYEVADGSGNAFYCGSLQQPGGAQLLAQNYTYSYVFSDGLEEILIVSQDEDWNSYLAVVSPDHDPIDLGQGYFPLMTEDGFYYIVSEGASVSPYDYVVDSTAGQEAGITRPNLEDYAVETYDYQQLSHDSDLSKYSEIYTSCTKPLYFWHGTMESAADRYADDPAIRSFVDTYGPQANEEGYIVVTNEIAAALQSMAETYGQHYDGEWLEFCFAYDVEGESYDYEAFNQAQAAYDSVADRVELREELRSGDYDIPLYSLYLYEGGTSTLVSDQVLEIRNTGNLLMYNTPDSVTPANLEEISSAYEFRERFYLDPSKENCFVGGGQTASFKLSPQGVDSFSAAWNAGYAELFLLEDQLFLSESSGALAVAQVTDGIAGSFTILSDNGELVSLDEEETCVYYGVHRGDGSSDLYRWKEGKADCLATGVALSGLTIYEDGSMLAYAGGDGGFYYYGGDLKLIQPNGAEELIAGGVTEFIRLDSGRILYLSDGDLYLYDGKESTLLATSVEYVWSDTSMPVSKVLYSYN